METTQDRSIREKLDSLDTLPEGYAPSLDSKWELLIAGQPEAKKAKPYFWYAAAASLLLLLGFGFLFLKTSSQPEAIIANSTKPVSGQKTVAFSIEKPGTKAVVEATEKVSTRPEIRIKNAMPAPIKTKAPANEIAFSKQTKQDEIQITDPEIANPQLQLVVAAAALNSKTNLRKKSRYVELDFDAPATPQRLPQPVQTAQLQFKIRLLPETSGADQTSVQQQNPLRLQHSF